MTNEAHLGDKKMTVHFPLLANNLASLPDEL